MRRRRYDKVKDGEGFEVEIGTTFLLECEDCGCVRKVAVAVEESGKIGLAFKVDETETRLRRNMRNVRARIRRVAQWVGATA